MNDQNPKVKVKENLSKARTLSSWLDSALTDIETGLKVGLDFSSRLLLLVRSLEAIITMDRELARRRQGGDYGVDPRVEKNSQLDLPFNDDNTG